MGANLFSLKKGQGKNPQGGKTNTQKKTGGDQRASKGGGAPILSGENSCFAKGRSLFIKKG